MMNTTEVEVNLYFEVSKGTDLERTAQFIQECLSRLDMVKEVEAVPEEPRLTGVEVAAAIGVTVIVLRGSQEVVKELRKLIQEIKPLVKEIKELKGSFIEVGKKRVRITDTEPTDKDLGQVASKT